MGCPQSKPKEYQPNYYVSPHVTHEGSTIPNPLHYDTRPRSPVDVKPSMVSTDVRDIEKAETDVLKVKHIERHIRHNTKAHRTDDFDITNSHLSPTRTETLVIRRGQPFDLSLEFDRQYHREHDDIRIVFRFGKRPSASSGTHVELNPSSKLEAKKWGAYVVSQNGPVLNLHVLTPPTCAVGSWELMIDLVKKGKVTTVYRYSDKGTICILFNPWCKDDQVYMPETMLLGEYILNETGKIYAGTYKKISAKPWSFGQFTGYVLDACLYILEKSKLSDSERGNPIIVCRKISALVNSLDDNGVVEGKWYGNYGDGTSPLDWTGSVDILDAFYRTRSPVKYGQCWVFAGVVTTVCRALGIPARCVTNFVSAHDTNASLTVDYHFDAQGNPLYHMDDSLWNYHVWNDVWMARPDLRAGYGGWQAIDSTPQEPSEGIYCLGPTSVRAVKRGEVEFPYDGRFVFSEVNADKLHWVIGADGSFKLERIDKHSVGRLVCTKRADMKITWTEFNSGVTTEMENITDQYKYKEGSEEERLAVRNASTTLEMGGTGGHVPEKHREDVLFELLVNDDAVIGDDIEVVVNVRNTSSSVRTLSGRISVSSMFYTGLHYKDIGILPIDDKILQPGRAAETISMTIKPETYIRLLGEQCYCSIYCMIGVEETKQTYTELEAMVFRKPELTVKAPEYGSVGMPLIVDVSFVNPLPSPLTNCELKIEGSGFKTMIYKQQPVESRGVFSANFEATPVKAGDREIIVSFTSQQLSGIVGARGIKIQ